MSSNNVEFTKEKLDRLIKVYQYAVRENKQTFWFEGHEYLVAYAKYLIEYLKNKFDKE
jgi:hypothetical protein